MTAALQPAKSATDLAGDLFLSGSYIELGISPWGNFGTMQGDTPSGYAQAGSQGVGLTYNQAGFGVNELIPTIDFFTPGTPYESFAAGYTIGGTNSYGSNYKDGSVQGITTTSLTNTSSGSALSAEWIGVLNSNLRVTIDYSFNATALYFTTTVTLTNISGSTMSDARYDREVDPDNTEYVSGPSGYSTINTIVAQQPGSGASEVTATSATGDTYYQDTGSVATLMYYSTDPNSRVAEGLSFSGTLNPFSTLFTTASGVNGAAPAGSTTGLSDTAININYDGGALAAGASTHFTYYTGLSANVGLILSQIAAAAAPVVTDTVATDGYTVNGTADPNATVTIAEGLTTVGTVVSNASGAWQFNSSILSAGPHTLIASETNGAGATGSAAAVSVTVPDSRFVLSDTMTTGQSGSFFGSNYSGPLSYLNAEYGYTGTDNVVLSANVANVFIHSGSGQDALQVLAGNNVLDGGGGSNWLVGASGADGGTDTFFVDADAGHSDWDTLLNFHPGDQLTLWGYNNASGSSNWMPNNMGAAGYTGATLNVNFGGGSAASAFVTFAGIPLGAANFAMSAGSSGGLQYLSVTRTS